MPPPGRQAGWHVHMERNAAGGGTLVGLNSMGQSSEKEIRWGDRQREGGLALRNSWERQGKAP
eukprot:597708-Pelagomonas_calceolata.AAC.2